MKRPSSTWKWPRSRHAVELTGVLLAGAYLGLLGPFGNYLAGEPVSRIIYWTISLLAGSLLLSAAYRCWRRVWRSVHLPPLVCWGFAWLSAAAVVAILSSGVAVRLWPQVSYIT